MKLISRSLEKRNRLTFILHTYVNFLIPDENHANPLNFINLYKTHFQIHLKYKNSKKKLQLK